MARKSQKTVSDQPKRKLGRDQSRKAEASRKPAGEPRVLDDRTRRDIVGVGLILLGIILFIAAVAPTGAIVTDFLSTALHMVFGIGCYLLPFFLAAMGACMLYRVDFERISLRVAVGLVLLFVALLGFVSLFTPLGTAGTVFLFDPAALTSHGGYIGSALAWVGLTLFGQVISVIIMLGIALSGVIVIGFSISAFLEKIQQRREFDPEDLQKPLPIKPLGFGRLGRGRGEARQTSTPLSAMADSDEPRIIRADARTSRLGGEGALASLAPNSPRRRHGGNTVGQSAALTQNLGTLVPLPDDPNMTVMLDAVPTGGDDATPPAAMTRKLGKKRAAAETRKNPKDSSAKKKKGAAPKTEALPADTRDGFQLPSMALLASSDGKHQGSTDEELRSVAMELQGTLEDFGVMADVVDWVEGPTVTLFKVDLPSGVRVNRITNLTDDIALALAAPGVRIFAPIPGTNYVGVEVPNRKRRSVYLPDVLESAGAGPLQVAIGEDVEGHSIVSDLAKMPHVLIAGTTGSGKSVEVNAMIMSILLRATPAEVRFIMIDPKRVEFAPYDGIPHLYVPVVTECQEASSALSWAVAEMERRLKMFSKCGARNIISFNEKAKAAQAEAEAAEAAGEETPENPYGEPIPYIVIVIDELADLMMNVGKEVEFSISRIAQLARAAGIHLIIATQRPSTNVVTGLIKANITCRIGLTVASGIDSRVILDTTGAENLIGQGDLLISKPEYPKPVRVQGPFVPEGEIAAVVEQLKSQGEPEYHSEILKTNVVTLGDSSPAGNGGSEADDPMVWEAADIVVSSGLGSTSNLQRRLKVGYARAGRIMDQLEEKGIVGPANGSRPREVLVDAMELETLKAFEANDDDAF